MQLSANQTLRYVTGVFAVLCFALSARAEDTSDAMAVLSIVNQRCVECHGSDAQEGDVRFDKLTGSPWGQKSRTNTLADDFQGCVGH